MTERLTWKWRGSRVANAVDYPLRYRIVNGKDGWRITINGTPIGEKQYGSFEAAARYVDYGGDQPRIEEADDSEAYPGQQAWKREGL